MLNGLDLFSGIGGLSIALSEWVRPIAYCEIDPYCQGVLLSRQMDSNLCIAPIWDDVKTLTGSEFDCKIDIIYAGFPCQDISLMGAGKGLDGKRSGLVYEVFRLLRETRSRFCFLENVPAITTRGAIRILNELAEMGYDCRFCVLSASSIGAYHKRERWFLLAKSKQPVWAAKDDEYADANSKPSWEADKTSESQQIKEDSRMGSTGFCWIYKTEHDWKEAICRMDWHDNGIPFELDRARAYGNAVVPAQAKKAFKILMGLDKYGI